MKTLIAALLVLSAVPVLAQNPMLGINAGPAKRIGAYSNDYDIGYTLGAEYSIPAGKSTISPYLEYSSIPDNRDSLGSVRRLSGGDVTSFRFGATYRYFFLPESVRPYIGATAGLSSTTVSEIEISDRPSFPAESELVPQLGGIVGVAIRMAPSAWFSVEVRGGYASFGLAEGRVGLGIEL